jgi:putative flippase GtrA
VTALQAGVFALASRYRRQLSFGVVGVSVMALGFLILLLLTGPAGLSPHVAYLIQAVVSVQLSFLLSRYWTWEDRRGRTRAAALREWRRFHASRIVTMPANQALFSLLILSSASVWMANAICIALTTVVNWVVGHHLVFGAGDERA